MTPTLPLALAPAPADAPPRASITATDAAFLTEPMVAPSGFREYDARWRFPEQINLPGLTALGRGIGTQMHASSVAPSVALGFDYRSYSGAVRDAVTLGLIQAGITVHDIGLSLSPMAYFAQMKLGLGAVAMITASHNPNGWTGVKVGFEPPLTHGPTEMAALRDIVLSGGGQMRPGGGWQAVPSIAEAYLDDLAGETRLGRPLKVVCATGNGTAGAFAPALLSRIGAEVVALHTGLDHAFPNYTPNPEALVMLDDMARAVRESGADLAFGFDGDGDRCGVVDATGRKIFSDKLGLILARDMARRHPGRHFVVDVKSTGLFANDPVLTAHGATVEYAKTGHSHMKRRVRETGALAGFEKSGHAFLAQPVGHGFDCALRVAVELCGLLDRDPEGSLAALYDALPVTYGSPTLSPHCPDDQKYAVVEAATDRLRAHAETGGTLGGHRITGLVTVNGARAELEGGAWALVRASSNTPNLVVVCESPESDTALRAIFSDLDALLREDDRIGPYDQTW